MGGGFDGIKVVLDFSWDHFSLTKGSMDDGDDWKVWSCLGLGWLSWDEDQPWLTFYATSLN